MTTESAAGSDSPSLVVAVGASAGGLAACKKLLEHVPSDQGLAIVVVMHLDPSQQSHIASFLGRASPMEATEVVGGERIEPNRVYVIAPATSLEIRGGTLQVGAPEQPHYRARPIDALFSSLAADQGERCVAIVLPGSGNDGAAGLREIHAAGGLCLVQDPDTAEHASMPLKALATGLADARLPPEEMGRILVEYANPPHRRPKAVERQTPPLEVGLEGILTLLGRRYGIDFSDYKKGTLERRTARRMGLKQISQWQEYLEYLRAHPEEVAALYGDVLIGVTRFFRDPDTWAHLEEEIVPKLLEGHDAETPVRIWAAGCATGEEIYGLAMVFLEQIEKRGTRCRLQAFGSDLSQEALAFARQGIYPAQIAADVPPARLRRFFRRVDDHFVVERTLRDMVTFAAHNLLSDPPFANLDLVSCRNVLIYLEPHAQQRLIENFHFALRPQGVLWLGSSETIGPRSDLFQTRSREHRLYGSVRTARAARYDIPRWVASRSALLAIQPTPTAPLRPDNVAHALERFVLHRHTAPCVAINRNLDILHFFGATGPYLNQPPGEARMDLLSWLRPGLYATMRTGVLEAIEHNRLTTLTDMRIERDNETARVEAIIEPVVAPRIDGVFLISFRDLPVLPPSGGPEVDTDRAKTKGDSLVRDLEQDLRNTRRELQAAVEQLGTANEEYRASHEELLSLNEELQSSNEELEMSKEELQSLNEELTTVNGQLEDRNQELRTLSTDLNHLLMSADIPVLFLDRKFRIRRFTPACANIMRIVLTDVGRPLEHIKMQIHDPDLLGDAAQVLESLETVDAEVSSQGGRWWIRRILPYRTEEDRIDGVCITFQDITALKEAARESEEARRLAEGIVQSSRTPMLVLDQDLCIVQANPAFFTTFRTIREETVGKRVYDLAGGEWDLPTLRTLFEELLPAQKEIRNYDIEHVFAGSGWRAMRLNVSVIASPDRPALILVSIEDVTDLRHAQAKADARAEDLAQDHRRKDEFLAMLGHELRNPLAALTLGLELMSMSPDNAEQVEELANMMTKQTHRMSVLLDQLLDVGRIISGKLILARDAVDITEICEAAVETVHWMIEAGEHTLTVSLPPKGSVYILGDAVRLAQVVENLVANASKYTENGGEIWLTATATADSVEISVRDNGVGIESDLLHHIFELFTQGRRELDRAQGGLGLGLTLVRNLVEMHGGTVLARSEGQGKGSEFVVTLPRLREGRVKQLPGAKAARQSIPSQRVLVVEDEADLATMLVRNLQQQGHDVQMVHDGQAALDTARDFKPQIVLLDLGLPGMDGYAVARQLREEHGNDMFLIAVTGYDRDRPRLAEAGFDQHLLKPIDLERLSDLLADGAMREPSADGQ